MKVPTGHGPTATRARPGWWLLLGLAMSGCTAFSAVRSAEVTPGHSVDVAVTVATPPGDGAGWFWSYDCASACSRTIPAVDVAFTRGRVPGGSARPYEMGLGLSGFYPYAHGYVQLRRGPRPWGVGGRLAFPLFGWLEASLLLRHDLPLGSRTRILLVPTLFVHGGSSPNGMNSGLFAAVAQGLGLEHDLGGVSVAPSVLVVAGRVHRTSYGRPITDSAVFAVLGLTARFGR